MTKATIAYIGLGSNLGERAEYIGNAVASLSRHEGIEVARVSELRETPPLGDLDQPAYLNGVCEIRTTLAPDELLGALQATEDALGRRRHGKWTARVIDLDLLLFGDQVIHRGNLTVPHPEMHLRSFVLGGLCQLAPDLVHPVLGESIRVLAERLNGADFVRDAQVPQLVSVAGIIGVGKTTLANKLAGLLEAQVLREPYDTNPYMPQVYAGHKELALDSQLYFLVNRAEQLSGRALAPQNVFLMDYVFAKELIYARRLLNDRQLELYESIYRSFADKVMPPVLAIYLSDSPEACLRRVRQRNRPYEQEITVPFLAQLRDDYDRLFADWQTCPLLRVSASALIDGADAAVRHLAAQVRAYVAARDATAAVIACESETNGSNQNDS
jgi:2-amino-4-hydroxy-6-hydroxymethyldihydropteridine diphosphokinase